MVRRKHLCDSYIYTFLSDFQFYDFRRRPSFRRYHTMSIAIASIVSFSQVDKCLFVRKLIAFVKCIRWLCVCPGIVVGLLQSSCHFEWNMYRQNVSHLKTLSYAHTQCACIRFLVAIPNWSYSSKFWTYTRTVTEKSSPWYTISHMHE